MSLEEKYARLQTLLGEIDTTRNTIQRKLNEKLLPQHPAKHSALQSRLVSLQADRDLLSYQISQLSTALENNAAQQPSPSPKLDALDTTTLKLLLNGSQLTAVPKDILKLKYLKELCLSHNLISTYPTEISDLKFLQRLDLSHNQLTTLPKTISKLTNLRFLYLSHNSLQNLENGWSDSLLVLEVLNLEYNKLTVASFSSSDFKINRLRSLSLAYNQLVTLPDIVCKFTHLIRLYVNNNQIETLPSAIDQLTRLQWLTLDYNRLTGIPPALCFLPSLLGLSLSHNSLSFRPDFPLNLRVLRLEANLFNAVPPEPTETIVQDDITTTA